MPEKQRTLKSEVVISGIGLHSGLQVSVVCKPAPENHGIQFKRVDIANKPVLKALAEYVTDTSRGTTIEENGVRISTIEHLMASFSGLKVDNVLVEVNAPEIPIMNGSAKPFIDAVKKAGIQEQNADRKYYQIKEKLEFKDEKTGIELVAYPDDKFIVDVHVEYNADFIRNQFATFKDGQDFEKEIGICKTFVFLGELEPLFKNNLIKGGDLDNAILIVDKEYPQEYYDKLSELFHKPRVTVKPEGVFNNVELVHYNEPARHKLLDVIGDISLTGMPLLGRIIAYKPGHWANTEFAKIIRKKIVEQSK